jgi:putative ABC transport system permease protein
LAAFGIYGVVSYSVTQRTAEIGLRMALGAERGDVTRMIVGQGLGLVGAGLGVGLLLSLAATRYLGTLLFGVSATDPWTYGGVVLLLVLAALTACYLPARRTARIDPLAALRHE